MPTRALLCLYLLTLSACQPAPRIPAKLVRAPLPAANAPAAHEALDEVNAARAKKGLRPFTRDDGLTAGAMRCAAYRAEHLIAGHTKSDFAFLPEGTRADAAGCGALTDDWGWQTCCAWDRQWSLAGAAWARGRDNRRFMHIFVKR